MWLHHARPQPAPEVPAAARSPAATRAGTRRRPTNTAGAFRGPGSYDGYDRGHRRSRRRRGGRRRAASVPPGSHAPGARGRQARPRREARVPADGGLSDGARGAGTGRAASCWSARTITTSRWRSASDGCWPRARSARWSSRISRRSPEAQDRRRLAQRRDDGGRGRVLRGGDSLAPPRREPGPRDRRRSAGYVRPPSRAAGRRRHAREEHAGGVPLRQRRGRGRSTTRARFRRSCGGCGCRSCSAAKASSRSNPTASSFWSGAKGFRGCCFPGFRDIRGYQAMYRDFVRAIREGPPPEMSLERAIEDQRLMDRIYASVEAAAPDAPPNATTSSSSAAAQAAARWRTRCRRPRPAS